MALKLAVIKSKKAIAAIAAGLAVLAGLVANLTSIGETLSKYVAPLFQKEARVAIGLAMPRDRYVRVALNYDASTGKFDAVRKLFGGKEMSFDLPANAQHHVQWQGFHLKPAAADIIVGEEASNWTLRIAGKEGDFDVLSLVETATQKQASATPVSATTLVAAANSGIDDHSAWNSASYGNHGPAMSRAFSVIGLMEVGSAECLDSLLINRLTIVYGCVGFLPGNLTQVFSSVEAREPGLIDRIMGPRSAEFRAAEHAFANPDIPTDDDFRRRMTALTRTPEFQAEYAKLNRSQYDRAVREARTLGLFSERGVLFVLDRIWHSGTVRRLSSAGERPSSFSPSTELRRLQQLAEVARQTARPEVRRFVDPRVNMIVSGRGKVNGVDFNLNALGIRYDKPLGA